MLTRTWIKGNVCTVSGKEIGSSTVINSMEVYQKIRNGTTIWSSSSTSDYVCKENENTEKDTCTLMFTAALFTIAKIQKQVIIDDKWIKKYAMEY